MPSFDWIPFYQELANNLLPFKNDRKSLVKKLKNVYEKIEIDFPKMESDGNVDDIDPFTVYGLFNKNNLIESKRIRIIQGIKDEFNLKSKVPQSFDGIPLLMPLQATFFYFKEIRGEDDIDRLWDVFEVAVSYADSPNGKNRESFIRAYNSAKDLKGLKWRFSMALYWVRPYVYLNLDSTSRKFIRSSTVFDQECRELIKGLRGPKKVPDGEGYLRVCQTVSKALKKANASFHDFPGLSHYAWIFSNGDSSSPDSAPEESRRYWLYAPGHNADHWEEFYKLGIMAIGWDEIGDLGAYSSQKEIQEAMKETYGGSKSYVGSAHITWQFANDMKEGDVVYVKKGVSGLLGRGEVTGESEYFYDESRTEYKNVRKIKWTHKVMWKLHAKAASKTLTDITPYAYFVNPIKERFGDDPVVPSSIVYTSEDFLNEVYMSPEDYQRLADVLKAKKNVVLQGAPGVGKTFAAKRLAYSIMGEKDEERVAMVQFHQSYSYEDFIMGFRPTENGFKLNRGVFYEFCKKAEEDPDNGYFFIIDEINRGNMSKIFGELFMLIERDKRGVELRMLYSNEKFSVPRNVYIIGMMNTADRSLAMLDFALRRRFAFFELKPGFDTEGFGEYQKRLASKKFDALIGVVKKLNETIESDDSLGKGFCIGHSFFCGLTSESVDARLANIVDYELIPLLQEYWYDEPLNVDDWADKLRAAIQ